MKIEEFKTFEYDCQDVKELLFLYVVWTEEVTFDERDETTKHLLKCPECRDGYLKLKQVAPVIRKNPQCLFEYGIFEPSRRHSSDQKLTHEEIMQIRFEAKLERAALRRKRRERREKIAKIKRMAKPISAIAACLVIGFGLFFAISQSRKNLNSPSFIASNQQPNTVKIELISGRSTEIIPAGNVIAAIDGLKTLKINNNRQMVLNEGTELLIEPYNLGCLVKLDKGEIYTHVEHDGQPFMVKTRHGRAVITGTTFNIKADHNKMDLAVVEGSVRFESANGSVSVQGGYQSSIISGTKPLEPVACDVDKVAAWTKPQGLNEVVRVSEIAELASTSIPYRNLEDINYDTWIKENRYWFEREFPWTMDLQGILGKDGIAVNPLDLLISSGVLIQFGYPEHGRTQLLCGQSLVMNRAALLASFNENSSGTRQYLASVSDGTKQVLGTEAFERWLEAIDDAEARNDKMGGELLLSSIHSAVFIKNTRSLAWFNVYNGRIQITGGDKGKVLNLLEDQVKQSFDCTEKLKELFSMDNNLSACKIGKYQEILTFVKEDIAAIKENEIRLGVYEISGK